jgi:hypothetical protein
MDLAVPFPSLLVPGYLKDSLGLVIEFGPDMATHIVIGLVKVQDGMDMEVVLTGPSHQ